MKSAFLEFIKRIGLGIFSIAWSLRSYIILITACAASAGAVHLYYSAEISHIKARHQRALMAASEEARKKEKEYEKTIADALDLKNAAENRNGDLLYTIDDLSRQLRVATDYATAVAGSRVSKNATATAGTADAELARCRTLLVRGAGLLSRGAAGWHDAASRKDALAVIIKPMTEDKKY